MSTNPIEHRDRLMAACSVTEHLIAMSPVVPVDFSYPGSEVDLMLPPGPQSVLDFAVAFDLDVSYRENRDRRPLLEAKGVVLGVRVRGWVMGDVADVDDFQAAVAPVGLPRQWAVAA